MPKRKVEPWSEDQCNNTYRRKRSLRACGECRRRKRKCDGRMPCSSCAGHGYRCDVGLTALSPVQTNGVEKLDEPSPEITSENQPAKQGNQETGDPWDTVVTQKRRSRIISRHSAAALPRVLGHELDDPSPPRLHSYAWNMGIRTECRTKFVSQITSLISEEECLSLSNVFFSTVESAFAFIEREWYFQRVQSRWQSMQSEPGLEAVMCGVIALGSFFSNPSHYLESKFIDQCVLILDMANAEPNAYLGTEFLAGWILRSLYMRLTTRPYMACMASQMAMHIAEVLGFHRELTSRSMITTSDELNVDREEAETRRRYFWTAWSLNYILSTEYGLTPVQLRAVTCHLPSREIARAPAGILKFVEAVRVLQDGCEDHENQVPRGEIEHYLGRLTVSEEDGTALLATFCADICLCLLRRVLCVTRAINKSSTCTAVTILKKAFGKIRELVDLQQPWWNLVSIPFQTICVCLWFNSMPMLSLLRDAMDLLRLLAHTFDTQMTREALATAQHLISASQDQEETKSRLRQAALDNLLQSHSATDVNLLFPDAGLDLLDDWLALPF
ncbi:uncharacterized protein DSM5745_04774 [Aspergillus mulundensis]|uniref:Zn(2)-C6 fungal-type domain-containing protein n=1 Tax=Aspergillus mulundensis TaxID=1810919 RepID=A0A3D8S4J2_9EURO|nr:hypothetical protein DSM5745_04774 [Aspergillus mulundensis]RDW81217.1 hypothetical protein DSM5745_04774 [Aspergillus mulundensis]